ncbi:hypothetical protein HYDPIDRAFT_118919 [Hydnomerulius pinastri MD-312]|uniref:PKS/mFAS DH domain-containing protein n=1 Tax=Hydnomerulius pinastri MD-312 TaxID=994086 RepID=A0A0C9W7U3_9AGAM|nr:hypothetical protein HYDPIDRAFT_118919 [Hydnomerulius pinastri MD-312]
MIPRILCSQGSFDFALHHLDLAAVPVNIADLANFLVPNGAILLSVSDSNVKIEDSSVQSLVLSALTQQLASISGSTVQASDFVDGKALIYVRVAEPTLSVPSGPFKSVIIQPFEHGQGDLIEITKHISAEAEFWITGNDDPAGIAALGIASCIIAESSEYKVYSLLFEDRSLDETTREKAVHELHRNSLLLEQHMKISKNSEVFVRRLVHGGTQVKDIAIPASGLSGASVVVPRLCTPPEGVTNFYEPKLPDYPYNKSYCWAESGSERSRRLCEKPRLIVSHHFRVNVDSHPDLTGHIVFDAVLFPASGYVESIENGVMVASDIAIHKPLVLNGPDCFPGHARCVINGDKWRFRASTNKFNDGAIILDSVYASGSFSRVNSAHDENAPRTFDFESKLARSRGSVTGDDFYDAIPSAYRYQDHFRNYLKVVHEIDDETSG